MSVRHCVNGVWYLFFTVFRNIVCYIVSNCVSYVTLFKYLMCETLGLCFVWCDSAFSGMCSRTFYLAMCI